MILRLRSYMALQWELDAMFRMRNIICQFHPYHFLRPRPRLCPFQEGLLPPPMLKLTFAPWRPLCRH